MAFFSLKGFVQVHRTTSPFSINVPAIPPIHRLAHPRLLLCSRACQTARQNPTIATVTPVLTSKLG